VRAVYCRVVSAPKTQGVGHGGPLLGLVRRLAFACTCVLALALAHVGVQAQGVARKPFSDDEKKRLAAGELVTRPTSEERGQLRLFGGTSWQVIDAAPDAVFRALLDTPRYPFVLPTVSRAQLVSEQRTLRRVTIEHKKGPLGIAYRVALTIDHAKRDITFKLNDALDSGMRAAWGFATVHPHGHGKSLMAWGLMADPGEGLIVALVRGIMHDWMLKVPWQTKRFVESEQGRKLYGLSVAARCGQADAGQLQKCAP